MADAELLGNTGIRWSAESIYKAEGLIEDGKVRRDREHDDVFFIEGSELYRVQTDGEEWITCTCPNGQARSRPNCYHTAAALMVLRDAEIGTVRMQPYVGDSEIVAVRCIFGDYAKGIKGATMQQGWKRLREHYEAVHGERHD